jgi:hypothetical protein
MRKEVLCNVLIEFGVPMKLVMSIKMCLNKTCSEVDIDKHLIIILCKMDENKETLYRYCFPTSV